MNPLLLASRSPRRRQLLREAKIPHEVIDIDVDESIEDGIEPAHAARLLALRKARAAAAGRSSGRILAADTLVAVGSRILGKPRDPEDARRMLRLLSGREHRVITGVCLLTIGIDEPLVAHDETVVVMRVMDDDEIAAYVDSGESRGKAGAYAIQESGDRFVERIEGSWSNVVGLPVELVKRLLEVAEG